MQQGFDNSTITWSDGIVHHNPAAFDVERVETDTGEVFAYADRPASLAAMLDAAVERAPNREAVIYPGEDRTDTYRELVKTVDRLAAGLAAEGIKAGDIVSMHLTNRPAFVETFLACARLGAIAAPINTRVSARELSLVLADTEPDTFVTEPDLASLAADADVDLPNASFVVDDPSAIDARPYADLFEATTDPPSVDIDEFDPCAIIYTSGTTGRPKGCVASNFNLVNGAFNYHESFKTDEGVRILVTVPLFHGAGLVSNLLHAVAAAGTTVVADGSGPETFLSTIETYRAAFTLTVPTTYVLAMEQGDPEAYDLSSFTTAVYGGAPMPAENVRRLRNVFPNADLCDGYGATENTAGLVTMCPDEYSDEYAHTIGLPTPLAEVTVVDEHREPIGPGEVGELAIKGPFNVSRYHNRPEATAETFENGWHYTGDLAIIDEDGFVELKGRSRDKIVRGGENIYVLDIEEVLTSHEKVLEASVTSFPDAVLGERVLAGVVPKPGMRLTEDELRKHAVAQLADYKIPEIVRILNELPKNPGGKVLKSELVPEPLRHGIQAGGD